MSGHEKEMQVSSASDACSSAMLLDNEDSVDQGSDSESASESPHHSGNARSTHAYFAMSMQNYFPGQRSPRRDPLMHSA